MRCNRYQPWALVIGGSEGLGESWAHALAASGLNIALLANDAAGLERVAGAIRHTDGIVVRTLLIDLFVPDAVQAIQRAMGDVEVGLLVCNTAVAPIGRYFEVPRETRLRTVDINCRQTLELIDAFVPAMRERGRGGLILTSSLSAMQGTAMVSLYAATKAFLLNLGEGLWEELRDDGVDVLVMVAGATCTPSFLKQTPPDKARSVFPMEPDAVVAEALRYLGKKPVHITGRINRCVYFVTRWLFTREAAIRFISRNTRKLYET